jgi:hypothetical protein
MKGEGAEQLMCAGQAKQKAKKDAAAASLKK